MRLFLVIFNHCEYQNQLLIFSVTDMSIFLFVIIITEKESLETKKKSFKIVDLPVGSV